MKYIILALLVAYSFAAVSYSTSGSTYTLGESGSNKIDLTVTKSTDTTPTYTLKWTLTAANSTGYADNDDEMHVICWDTLLSNYTAADSSALKVMGFRVVQGTGGTWTDASLTESAIFVDTGVVSSGTYTVPTGSTASTATITTAISGSTASFSIASVTNATLSNYKIPADGATNPVYFKCYSRFDTATALPLTGAIATTGLTAKDVAVGGAYGVTAAVAALASFAMVF